MPGTTLDALSYELSYLKDRYPSVFRIPRVHSSIESLRQSILEDKKTRSLVRRLLSTSKSTNKKQTRLDSQIRSSNTGLGFAKSLSQQIGNYHFHDDARTGRALLQLEDLGYPALDVVRRLTMIAQRTEECFESLVCSWRSKSRPELCISDDDEETEGEADETRSHTNKWHDVVREMGSATFERNRSRLLSDISDPGSWYSRDERPPTEALRKVRDVTLESELYSLRHKYSVLHTRNQRRVVYDLITRNREYRDVQTMLLRRGLTKSCPDSDCPCISIDAESTSSASSYRSWVGPTRFRGGK